MARLMWSSSLLIAPRIRIKRFQLFFSSLKTIESDTKTLQTIKNFLSWKNSVKIFNSLKKVDIKFAVRGAAGNKEPKYLKEPTTLSFEPLFFAMPQIIRNEFEKFNETTISELFKSEEKEKGLRQENLRLHQFLPDENFMNQVMSFRFRDANKTVHLKETDFNLSFIGSLKRFFAKETKPKLIDIDEKRTVNFGRKISLLGFHGWFPNKLIQKVIGDPRRTSSRMVDMMESAIFEAEPFPPFFEGPASVYKFPLQGEGNIEDRVEKHFEELQKISTCYVHEGLTSLQHLQESDTIILGAHSQGAPVSVILLAKLLDAGIINLERQNVTILTVAGIFHGPFPPLRKNLVVQYVEADAARQLFDLNDPDSKVSQLFAESLDKVLQSGINMTCVASWLDQVVPFYSACLLGFEHPNIWRSVHINADHYKPDFLTKLVEIGLKIKNTQPGLGEPETHMILSEVSEYISGSIYKHSTHSSAYRKNDSFKTALKWMKMGPNIKNIPIKSVDHVRHRPLQATVNPYYLPWLFRGWLNCPEIVNNPLIGQEILELQKMYDNWKPESKILKDFKFILEPISLISKL